MQLHVCRCPKAVLHAPLGQLPSTQAASRARDACGQPPRRRACKRRPRLERATPAQQHSRCGCVGNSRPATSTAASARSASRLPRAPAPSLWLGVSGWSSSTSARLAVCRAFFLIAARLPSSWHPPHRGMGQIVSVTWRKTSCEMMIKKQLNTQASLVMLQGAGIEGHPIVAGAHDCVRTSSVCRRAWARTRARPSRLRPRFARDR